MCFFFKQKTAYEMLRSLVGSEMCIRDSGQPKLGYEEPQTTPDGGRIWLRTNKVPLRDTQGPVSYTHLTLPTIYPV